MCNFDDFENFIFVFEHVLYYLVYIFSSCIFIGTDASIFGLIFSATYHFNAPYLFILVLLFLVCSLPYFLPHISIGTALGPVGSNHGSLPKHTATSPRS